MKEESKKYKKHNYNFSVHCGIRHNILNYSQNNMLQPVYVFNLLINEEVLTYILHETNKYAIHMKQISLFTLLSS